MAVTGVQTITNKYDLKEGIKKKPPIEMDKSMKLKPI